MQHFNTFNEIYNNIVKIWTCWIYPEHADWLSSRSTVFQPPYIRIISFKYYGYCVMKSCFKSISGENIVV